MLALRLWPLLLLFQWQQGVLSQFLYPQAHSSPKGPQRDDATLCSSLPEASLSEEELSGKIEDILGEVQDEITKVMQDESSPGGAVLSLVYKDSLVWTAGFGLKNMSDTNLGVPDENTRFRIGSITKLFTALQTLMMRDSSKIASLDDDITQYYPEFAVINPFLTSRGITFRQLMSHMSGLGRNSPCKDIFTTGCNISDAEMLKNIAGMRLMFPPGTQPAYSNLGFGLLGKVLVQIAKVASWDDLLTKMIVQPLGMNNTGNSFKSIDAMKTAIGYYPDGKVAEFIDIGWDSSAGQSYSSAADLAKLMSLVFSSERSSRNQLVDGETLREWMQPAYKFPDGKGFSFPWELLPVGSYTLRTKDGVMNGYNAEFQMAAESKVGFIFLQSCDGCPSHRRIISVAQQLLLSVTAVLASSQPPPSLPPNPKDYVGVYNTTTNVVVNISLSMLSGNPALMLVTTQGGVKGAMVMLEWRQDDAFQVSVRGIPSPCFLLASGQIGAWVYFHRDSSNVVTSFTAPSIAYGLYHQKQLGNT